MPNQKLLGPDELQALYKHLDALIEEAKELQRDITEKLINRHRDDLLHVSGPAKKPPRARKSPKRSG